METSMAMGKKIIKVFCKDCAKELNKKAHIRKIIRCRSCCRKGKLSHTYKHGETLKEHKCLCGREMDYRAKQCKKCYIKNGILPGKSNTKEYKKLYKRKYIIAYPEYIKKQYKLNKIWRNKNKSYLQKYFKQYRKKNLSKILLLNKNRKIKLKGIKGNHTFKEWEELKKQFNYKCAICGITEKKIKKKWKNTNFDCLTKDHVIPISKNGTNFITNIRPVCISCNSKKKNKTNFKSIFTCGTWDILHVGHLNIIKAAKEMGEYLIVGVSSDNLVKKYKQIKPIIPYKERKNMILSLKYVDKVVRQDKLINIAQFKRIKADLFIIGNDWEDCNTNAGLNWLKQNNKVLFFPYTESVSSTAIKNRIIGYSKQIQEAQIKKGWTGGF